ncbi:MAG TPA: metallophosphoesterase [bacterium]|nr:metallophosphoesterase [bacterium]
MQLFPLKKLKLVVSDFHLGKGRHLPDGSPNLLEDFNADRQFVEFLDYYMNGSHHRADVELILNGDFFNLLQIDYRNRFSDVITESDALHKTMSILKGHPGLFDKLAEFSRLAHHSVTFVLGNHDPGLLWEGVREAVRLRLGGAVKFVMEAYEFDGVHVEHGNQYQADNRYDREHYFLSEGLPEPIINLPFGSFFVIHYLNELKKERPYIDKVHPFAMYKRWALLHDTWFAIRSALKVAYWFIKFLITPNPARKLSWRQILGILRQTTVHPRLHKEAERILMSREENRIVVFGHTHQHLYMRFKPGKEYFNTGTWNEKISLEVGSLGRFLRLTFVQIDYDDKKIPHGSLKEWKGHTNVIEELVF